MSEMCTACAGTGYPVKAQGSGLTRDYNNVCTTCGGTGRVQGRQASSHGNGSQPQGSGSSCFPSATRVLTPRGWRAIASLSEGEQVLSVNRNGTLVACAILKRQDHPPASIVTVHMKGGESLRATDSHSMKTQRGWVRICNLKIGDALWRVDPDGRVKHERVERVEAEGVSEPVFNLVVASAYTFIAEGCIAHSFSYFRGIRMAISECARRLRELRRSETRKEGILL
jgi:hypothetical protein